MKTSRSGKQKIKNSPQKHKQKVFAFIDSQNLNLGVKSSGWDLDFKKFRIYLSDKYNVEKAYLFIGHIPGNELLYTSLQEYGYIVIFKPTLEFKKKERDFTKGNVDAELVLHTMIHINNFDTAIIVSGDGDFHCLIEYLQMKQKLHKIIVPNDKYSSLLKKFAKNIVKVNQIKQKVELKKDKN